MNFYGVGVKFGGVDDMLPLFLEKNCWFMGWKKGEKPKLDKVAQMVNAGDVLIAKAYSTTLQSNYYVRAIGIVADTKKPNNIPDEYQDRLGFTVIWVKYFEKSIPLPAKEYRRGTFQTSTIFHEGNPDMIKKIQQMMKYDYTGESAESIPDETYIDIAKQFVYSEAFDTYDNAEISEHSDPEIVAQDSFGRKIVHVPFVGDGVNQNGLILLIPEKAWHDDEVYLTDLGCIIQNHDDFSETIEELKSMTDWNMEIEENNK